MKRFNLAKGISATLVAMGLAVSLVVPVTAAKTDMSMSQEEVTQVGAATVGAPAIALKEQKRAGQITTAWTFTYSPVPAPVKVPYGTDANDYDTYEYSLSYAVFDQGDRTKPVIGSVYTDDLGKKVVRGSYIGEYVDPAKNPDKKYEFTINMSQLTAGKKEVVAYLYDEPAYEVDVKAAYEAAVAAYEAAYEAWSANGCQGDAPKYPSWNATDLGISKADYYVASAPVVIDVSEEAYVATTVTASSIELAMHAANGTTGFEVSRKIDGKYKVVGTVASHVYTDKGLESKATYSYKVRPYYVNKTTGTTTYGKYTVVEATTKGSALNAQLSITSKDKVKLTWKKVANATKYEIYRLDTTSQSSSSSKGLNNSYASYKKIASLKSSKKTYTDKNVSANRSYAYIVRAILGKDKKVKNDKDRYIEQFLSTDLSFGSINVTASYTDEKGNKTVTWEKVNGADGYVIDKSTYLYTTADGRDIYDWQEVTKLGKNKTTYKFTAQYTTFPDNTVDPDTRYRIRAYKGTATYSEASIVDTTVSLGNVKKVTATNTDNGIKVSWTPVAGAAYYKVYRVRTDHVENDKDKDKGAYEVQGGTQVTEYVGVTAPVAVDVAAWNAAVDASIAQYKADFKAYADGGYQGDFDYNKYLNESDKLSVNKGYHYQNYSYARDVFDASTTSIVDYFGDIYTGSWSFGQDGERIVGADGMYTVQGWKSTYDPVVSDDDVSEGPKAGVSYTYYVQAFAAPAGIDADYDYDNSAGKEYNAAEDKWYRVDEDGNKYPTYRPTSPSVYHTQEVTVATYNTAVTGPQVDSAAYASTAVVVGDYGAYTIKTWGVKTVGEATYTLTKAASNPKLKSVSSSKKKVTVKIKKKVAGADYYKIYRSTKKKGTYVSVGVTKNAKTLKFTDSGLTKGKTYYYKVVAVTKNEAGAEVESKASDVKKVKVK